MEGQWILATCSLMCIAARARMSGILQPFPADVLWLTTRGLPERPIWMVCTQRISYHVSVWYHFGWQIRYIIVGYCSMYISFCWDNWSITMLLIDWWHKTKCWIRHFLCRSENHNSITITLKPLAADLQLRPTKSSHVISLKSILLWHISLMSSWQLYHPHKYLNEATRSAAQT